MRQLVIRGTVDIEDDADHAVLTAVTKKYIGQDTYPWHQPGDERVVVRVTPGRVTTVG